MGRIQRLGDDADFPLAGETLVGRSRAADLRLDADYVSGIHASLSWSGTAWLLRDLGSRNGTMVNGERLEIGKARALHAGDKIAFGKAVQVWTLCDDADPLPIARGPAGQFAHGAMGLLAIPHPDDPQATIVHDGAAGWLLEIDDQQRAVEDRERVLVQGKSWTIRLPQAAAATLGARPWQLTAAQLSFRASRAGETRAVHVKQRGETQSFELGSAGPLFAALGQARCAGAEEGWVDRDRLFLDLGVNSNHLNVLVFRLRRAFADAAFVDASTIVERQRGRLRLGCEKVEILADGESG